MYVFSVICLKYYSNQASKMKNVLSIKRKKAINWAISSQDWCPWNVFSRYNLEVGRKFSSKSRISQSETSLLLTQIDFPMAPPCDLSGLIQTDSQFNTSFVHLALICFDMKIWWCRATPCEFTTPPSPPSERIEQFGILTRY